MARHKVDFGEATWPFTTEKVYQAIEHARAHGLAREWRDSNPAGQGLCLRVGPRSAAWYARLRVDGRMVGHKLGSAEGPGRLSVDAARRALQQHRFGIETPAHTAGSGSRRASRCSATIAEVFTGYIAAAESGLFSMRRRRREPLRPKTATGYRSVYNAHLSAHGDRSLSWLAENAVTLFEGFGAKGQGALANQLKAVVKAMFEFARREGIWQEANPIAANPERFESFVVREREVNLTDGQMAQLLKAVRGEDDPFNDLLTVAIYSGQRIGNVCSLRWDQLDLDRGLVTFSAGERKNKRGDTLPLSATVIKILKARQAACGDSPYVFPSARSSSGHVTTIKFAWARVVKRAGLEHVPDLCIHGLRHNFGSWGQESGVADGSVTAAVGHASSRSTERYRHGRNAVVAKPAVDAVAARLDKAAKRRK